MDKKKLLAKFLLLILLCFGITIKTWASDEIEDLKTAYPDTIQDVTSSSIIWKDGTHMPIRDSLSLIGGLQNLFFHRSGENISKRALICDNYEPFFKKMYGGSPRDVRKKLVTIYWMPHVFGNRYPLKVTTVNGIHKRLRRISAELEKLPPSHYKYLVNPGGTFYWRKVARQSYLSAHSFGIAIDINSERGNYWLWDLEKSRSGNKRLVYRNHIPMRIVKIFEKEGFLWGGRWHYYDTMHFEYHPELFVTESGLSDHFKAQLRLHCLS